MTVETFALSYDRPLLPLFRAVGAGPSRSRVEVAADRVRVRMGWVFQASFPRRTVRSATRDHGRVTGWGVHGWRGRWLVNGSSHGLVRLDLDPGVRGRVLGCSVQLRTLRVSTTRPDELVDLLTGR